MDDEKASPRRMRWVATVRSVEGEVERLSPAENSQELSGSILVKYLGKTYRRTVVTPGAELQSGDFIRAKGGQKRKESESVQEGIISFSRSGFCLRFCVFVSF